MVEGFEYWCAMVPQCEVLEVVDSAEYGQIW